MTFLLRWMTLTAVFGTACAANAADSAALAKRLHNAADLTSLDDPTLKPWHLKMAVQLYDAKGNPSEQGTIEEWWTREKDKRVYEAPSYKTTEIRAGGAIYRLRGQPAVPYLLEAIREEAIHPMPSDQEIESSKRSLKVESFGSVKLDCIVLSQELKNASFPSPVLTSEYCLAQSQDLLRASYRYGSESANFNSIGKFQGRKLGLDISLRMHQVKAISGHITSLQTIDRASSFFDISEDMVAHGDVSNSPKAMDNLVVNKVLPVYPQRAKEQHISGTVRLAASIGTDGYIQNLIVIDAPDSSLRDSALRAVKQWVYKPYLLNGLPVEVDAIVYVHYNFGPG